MPEMPAAIVDNGTRPNQRVVTGTIETLAEQAIKARLHGPAIIIIGTVVTLRQKLVHGQAAGQPGGAATVANSATTWHQIAGLERDKWPQGASLVA